MSISRKSLAYRTGAVYFVLFIGLLVYFGLYRKQAPAIAMIGVALLLVGAGVLKLWLLSYVGRQLSDERWIERAVDVGLDVLFLVVFVLVFIWLGRMA